MKPSLTNVFWFELGRSRYAIRLQSVQEVLRAVAIAPLPGAPAIVEGVIDVRGVLVPVLDVRTRFGHGAKELELSDVFILARYRDELVALRADAAGWPVSVEIGAFDAAAAELAATPYVRGVARLPDGLVVIHDLDAFLTDAERTELGTVLAVGRSAAQRK